ncbi:MAG: iron complex outermembrane receptor protein, partial [Cyclobacteriaceae bacterium]
MMFSFCTYSIQAQQDSCSYTLTGQVLDIDTKEALPYVSVKVKDIDKFAVTDINGKFVINGLCDQENMLIISCFGYCNSVCEQHHQHGKVQHIYLRQEVLELNEVTITTEKSKEEGTVSISQQTLARKQISSDPSQSLASVLSEVEGVTFASTGSNVQLPIIHGLYGNRILILNNGVKHGFQNWGTDHAPEIDISSANSITVVKGTAGVRYGPEALGGAVIVEADPLHMKEPFKANIGTGYQTNGRGYFTTLDAGQGFKKWSYHIGGNYTRIGDRHTPDYSLTNSGKEERAFNAGFRYHLSKWDFKIYYSYVDQNLALLRSSVAESGNLLVRSINSEKPIIIQPFSYAINEPNQLTQHHFGKTEINWWYRDNAKLTLRAGRQINNREEYDVRRNADKPIIDLDLITNDVQLEWKHPDWAKLDGLVGLQIFTQNNDNNPGTGTTPFIPNYNTTRYSGFLVESLKIGVNTVELGLRVDFENNNVRGRETNQDIFQDQYSFTNLTSSIGLVREFSDNSTFRTNIGTAWRTPNMAELYSFGQHGFKTSFGLLRYYTNEDGALRTDRVIKMVDSQVAPEKGYKWINEWQTKQEKNTYTVTAYSHYIQNYIFDRPVAVVGTIRGPMPVFIFEQADALFIGMDLTWQKIWTENLNGIFG